MPGGRRRSRQRALQVLFQCDLAKQPVERAISSMYETLWIEREDEEPPERDEFMEQLAKGTMENVPSIDRRIADKAEHWTIERMPVVDRNILRLAVFEMSSRMSPPAVVIDEALELARRFSGEESVSFINGVLDAVNRDSRQPEAEAQP